MRVIIINAGALFLSISLLLVANGLQMTLLGLRAQIEGFSTVITGFMMSAYFVGYILGALTVPNLVEKVGHIRVFVALASLTSAAAILHAFWIDPYIWTFLRIVSGYCLVGLYLVTESWLNEQSNNDNRGQVFSFYMIINLASVAIGQKLLIISDPNGVGLFIISTVLFSLAVVPIALMNSTTPISIPNERMRIKKLYALSPVGVTGAFLSGLINGAFWGMASVYAFSNEYDTARLANFMMVVVIGGMILQWPLGKLSDKTDRRYVIILTCFGLIISSLIMVTEISNNITYSYGAAFFLGGFLLTTNSLCTAHANDHIHRKDFVQASGTLLLLFGFGAMLGPYIASLLMQTLNETALFIFIASIALLFLIYTTIRCIQKSAPETSRKFRPLPFATQRLVRLKRNKQ
jgi:MFS family permease